MWRLILASVLMLFSLSGQAQRMPHQALPVIEQIDKPLSVGYFGELRVAPVKSLETPDPDAPAPLVVSIGDFKPPLKETYRNWRQRQMTNGRMLHARIYEGYRQYHPFGAPPLADESAPEPPSPIYVNLYSNLIAPFVEGLTISPVAGSYSSGQTFIITMVANGPITVSGGTPSLTLNTSPSTTTANYCGGSGTAYLQFCYTATTNLASPLATTSAAFAANGATLSNAGGNLNITNVNNVSFGVNIIAPGSGPSVVGVTSSPATGNWPTGTPITFYVQFTGNISVSGGTPTLNLGTSPSGSAASCGYASGAYLTCTYTVGANTENPVTTTSSAISLNGATISGSGGSAVLSGANSQTLTGLQFNAPAACPGTQYYVSNSGNDANTGTSTASAWQTPAHVSSVTSYGPTDCVSFNGNDAQAIGYIVNNTLTVLQMISGTINVNDTVAQPYALLESQITAYGSGSGGTGTYTLGTTDAQNVGSVSQPILITFGQAFNVPTSLTDSFACFSISATNVSANSGNFTVNTYGGPTAALLSNSGCAGQSGGYLAMADINGVNATWNGVGLFNNGQLQNFGLYIANNRGSTVNSITVQNTACVGIHTDASHTTNYNNSSCFPVLVNYAVTNVTFTGDTATGENGPASLGDAGFYVNGAGSKPTNYTVQGFECKNFGGRNVYTNTGACVEDGGAQSINGLVQYGFIRDVSWNVFQCGGMSGMELYNTHTYLVQFLEIWNVRPSTWATGNAPGGTCDWDGFDNDAGAGSTVQYIYAHDNFGTGIYAWANDVSGSTWGPFIARYSISINNGYGCLANCTGGANRVGNVGIGGNGGTSGCAYFYNLTVINTSTNDDGNGNGAPVMQVQGVPACGLIANNIFASAADTAGHNNFVYYFSFSTPGITWKANAYVALTPGTFRATQYGSSSASSLTAWQGIVPGGDTGATQANPNWAGTPTAGLVCGPGGNGGNQPILGGLQNIGPQPCPTALKLTSASTAYKGTGYPVSSPGTYDYYGYTINPSAPNIGAYGGP